MSDNSSEKIEKKPMGESLGITPLGDRVVVRPKSHEEHASRSGIIIPDTVSKEKPEEGTVVAVGRGRVSDDGTVIPTEVAVGDRVMFAKYAPDEIKIDDEEYYVMSESSILAILK